MPKEPGLPKTLPSKLSLRNPKGGGDQLGRIGALKGPEKATSF